MRKFFEGTGPFTEGRLKAILTSIRGALADRFDWPIKLWMTATADLPTFNEADHEGAILYDSTLDRLTYGNHTAWVTTQDWDAQLAAIAGLTPAADQIIYWGGPTTAAMTPFTASARDFSALNVAEGDLLYGLGAGNWAKLAFVGTATRYLGNSSGSLPAWEQVNLTNGVTGTLPVGSGGIGAATITGLMQGNGTSAVTGITNSSTVGQCLRVTGASTYAWGALNLADTDAITGDLPFANLTQGSALSVLGVTGNSTADNASIAAGSDHQVLRRSGTAVAFGAVNLAQAAAVTGVLPVGNSDTGTSGAKLSKLDGANTWSALQTFQNSTGLNVSLSGHKTLTSGWGSGASILLEVAASTITDDFTAAAGTVTNRYGSRFAVPTYASTNAMTVTTAVTLEVAGRPTAAANVTITNGWAFQCTAGNMNMQAGDYYRGGTKVLGARATGWAADSSTAKRTGNAAYNAVTLTTPPTQAELQAISTALTNVSQAMRALKDDLITHGLIGA